MTVEHPRGNSRSGADVRAGARKPVLSSGRCTGGFKITEMWLIASRTLWFAVGINCKRGEMANYISSWSWLEIKEALRVFRCDHKWDLDECDQNNGAG